MTDCSFILEPLDVSDITSLANLPSLNYTNQDFSSMKTRLVQYIQQNFTNDFTDFVEGDLGIMLIENWAFLADTLSFKMDQIVNELFIDTVTELDNAFRLCQLVGFAPTPPIASRAMFSATIQTPLATDLVITEGLRFDISASGQSISFELYAADSTNNPVFNQDIIIPAGNLTNTSIIGLQGTTVTDNFTSDGTINQTFTLSSSPVIFDSVSVTVGGQQWDQVPYFTDSKGRNEYLMQFGSTWVGFVMFGNGSAGRVPSSGSQIQVTYRTGGGTIGNIITGAIQGQVAFDVPGFNFSIPVSFVNYTKGSFGYDGDTIDDIRRKLPQYIATQNRAVTGSDYQTLSGQFTSPYNGKIGKSLATLRNYGCAANIVDIYVLALSGVNSLETASDELKAELGTYLDTLKMMTDYVCIRDGVVLPVDVTMDVNIDKFYRKFQTELQNSITNNVNNFFTLNNWDYGQSLKETDILRTVAMMPQVISATAAFTTSDPNNGGSVVTAAFYEIIRPDTISINLTFE